MSPTDLDDGRSRARQLADHLVAGGYLITPGLYDVVAAMPRHLFCPETTMNDAYAADQVVVVKRDQTGTVASSLSAPVIQAVMLDQAGIEPGMRVLEVGSGGVNAAMIAELVGPSGQVTTIDIDPYVVDRARRGLIHAGYPQVRVSCADAEHGAPDHAPYDRIVVTVGAWDVPPAWIDQLATDGRLVVPLRLNGFTRSIALDRDGERLVSRSVEPCGFVPMQGQGAHTMTLVPLDPSVTLRFDHPPNLDAAGLTQALHGPREEHWSGITMAAGERVDDLTLWLATAIPDCGMLTALPDAIDQGLVGRPARMGVPALIRGDSFACRAAIRPINDADRSELGVHGHGPRGAELADQYVDLIRQWDRHHRHGPGAQIQLNPAGTPEADLPRGFVLTKTHTRTVISWP